MNKIYKVIWNATLGTWVAVSELAKGKTKASKITGIVGAVTVTFMVTFSPHAFSAWNNSGTGAGNTSYGTAGNGGIAIGTNTYTYQDGGTKTANGNASASVVTTTNQGILDRRVGSGNIAYVMNGGTVLATSIAIGAQASVDGSGGLALGSYNMVATGTGGVSGYAIGLGNYVAGSFGVALGTGNTANGLSSTSIGTANQASGNTAIAMGRQSYATGDYSIAQGNIATASGANAVAIGNGANATNTNTIAIGTGANTGALGPESLNNIAIGANAKNGSTVSSNPAGTGGQVALGSNATTTTFAQIAIGVGANAGPQNYGIAIGGGATVTANSGVAVGGVAMGRNTQAGSFAVGIGPGAQATGSNSAALGNGATANTTGSVALGNTANATIANSVALGANAVTSATTNAAVAQTINGKAYTATGDADAGAVSVGSATLKRQIQNVAAGQVNATSTDAINGSQLFNTNAELAQVAMNTASALGGGATAGTAAGGITAPSYTITKTDGTNYGVANSVATALSNLNAEVVKPITFTGNTGSSANKLGSTLNIKGGATAASSNANVKTVVTNGNVDIQIVDAPTFAGTVTSTGLQVNGNSTVTGTQTVTGVSNLNGGANLNSQKITGLAAGTAATDAVNFGQLTTTNNNVTTAQNAANAAQTTANTANTTANTAVTNAAAAQTTANTANTTANTAVKLTKITNHAKKFF